MTPSAVGMVFAVIIFIGGALYFSRMPAGRTRQIGIVASAVVAVAVGWFAWLAGTQA